MTSPLHPALFRYLRSVQASDRVGLHGFFRRNPATVRSSRTVYRWQQRLGDQLLIVPNVLVERLGLRHAHLFVTHPDPSWLSFPYAVEAAWVTPDFCQEVCYVHCLVPTGTDLDAVVGSFPCTQCVIVWSGTGWQQWLTDDEEIVLPVAVEASSADLLRRAPFVLPAMTELWTYPNSLPLAWHRIMRRLGDRVKQFLPRTRVHAVNGKTPLTSAFRLLKEKGVLQQQLIRYHPLLAASVEVFLQVRMDREDLKIFLGALRGVLHAIETYPTTDGYWVRLLGPHQLLDAIINLPRPVRDRCSSVHFHTKRHPAPTVRFHYETLFDPTTKTWRAL